MSTEPPQDVPSPIELREMTDARKWEASAEQRPGRSEILDRFTQEAAQLTRPGDRILELGSGPGFLAQRLRVRPSAAGSRRSGTRRQLPDVDYFSDPAGLARRINEADTKQPR
jgi:hypothetical protein